MKSSAVSFENSIRFNHKNRVIELTKSFDEKASRFGSDEYNALQDARKDYPNYHVIVARRSKREDSYKGLTYEFMENYINTHDNAKENMAAFDDLRATSEEAKAFGAQRVSYGEIKAWFFKTYPEIEAFQKRREELLAA